MRIQLRVSRQNHAITWHFEPKFESIISNTMQTQMDFQCMFACYTYSLSRYHFLNGTISQAHSPFYVKNFSSI